MRACVRVCVRAYVHSFFPPSVKATMLLDQKLFVSLGVATAVSCYAWWTSCGSHRQLQQQLQQYTPPPSFPLKLFLITFVATYGAMYMAQRISSGMNSNTAAAEQEDCVIVDDESHSVARVHTVRAPPLVPSPPVPPPPPPSAPPATHGGGRAPKVKQLALGDAMRHVDMQPPPF